MTMSMDLLHATPRDAEGNMIGPAPSKIELHFHGPVTLNMIMPGRDQGAEEPRQLDAGEGVLGPLACETQAMLPTHPNNAPKSGMWRMDQHPYYVQNYVQAADDHDDDEDEEPEPADEDEPEAEEDDSKGRWSWIPGRRSRVAAE